ncbi:MAG: DUF4926 domain-containing protein [Prochloraceae cyanobacterium]
MDNRAWLNNPEINNLLSVVVTGERKMTANTIKLLDVVALTVDLPDYNLWRGQVGTVVEILADGKAFEVEFSDRNGRTFESIGLRSEQIMVLHFEPTSPDFKPEMVTV